MAPDNAALAKWTGIAARDGRTLSLKLAGNRLLKFTDCTDQSGCEADDTRVHRLVDWWPEHHLYVVAVGLYEEGAAYLVSKAIRASRLIAFPDLGMEAIYEFTVEDMPVMVGVDVRGVSVHDTGPAEWRQRAASVRLFPSGTPR